MFFNQLWNAVFQVVVFSVIPFIWWLITARKKESFFKWLGLKKPECENRKNLVILTLVIMLACFVVGMIAKWICRDFEDAQSAYAGMGFAALPSVFAYSYIQTAFSEEILFRGFLLKRLSSQFGFKAATIIQALIFGATHLLMVWGQVGIALGIVIVVYPMIPAVAFAYLNEKKAGGSILLSWIAHGTLNTVSALFQLF